MRIAGYGLLFLGFMMYYHCCDATLLTFLVGMTIAIGGLLVGAGV